MSIDGIDNRKDLERFVHDAVRKPGVLPAAPRPSVLLKEGVPTDADFDGTPLDGTEAIDTTGPTRYTRLASEWVAV